MLMMRTIFDMGSIFTEVIPVDNPVVVNAETESKSESAKFVLSICDMIHPVRIDTTINRTIT
jgi:hypothetical protein